MNEGMSVNEARGLMQAYRDAEMAMARHLDLGGQVDDDEMIALSRDASRAEIALLDALLESPSRTGAPV